MLYDHTIIVASMIILVKMFCSCNKDVKNITTEEDTCLLLSYLCLCSILDKGVSGMMLSGVFHKVYHMILVDMNFLSRQSIGK